MAEQELAAVQMASMDELTLLSNRRGFEALARHALGVCKRLEKPATLLFFDLNDFKQINDTYGHAEGDGALKTFADVLRIAFRERCDQALGRRRVRGVVDRRRSCRNLEHHGPIARDPR